jgi:hypothetical protein
MAAAVEAWADTAATTATERRVDRSTRFLGRYTSEPRRGFRGLSAKRYPTGTDIASE